jgi:DNA polymerase-3 subunit delta'
VIAWHEIEGQSRPMAQLQRGIEKGRVHPGQLFVGPEGVGKFATALAYTRILNCVSRQPDEFAVACRTCPSCRKLDNELQHPDVHVVLPTGNVNKSIKIDQVRAIQKVASTRPYEGRWQVVIFDDAHAMTDEASNALLKTLEEPPARMALILVSDQQHALLDTIRSRCQTVRFGGLEQHVVARILRRGTDPETDPRSIDIAARFGAGSVGRAREVLDSGLLDERADLFGVLTRFERSGTLALLGEAEATARDRARVASRLELLGVLLRDVLMWQVGIPTDRLINADLVAEIATVGRAFDVEAVLARIDAVRVARELLTRNAHATLVVEHLYTELAPGPDRAPIRLPRL